ncbi:nuclear transport factor 2 family protein [Thalassobaculum sp.]|uniref:nuclear transport factor 2 family protein n=1 Tax=Thalassobaculum sp. TaxID=2022740 RepID=UPI0032EBAF20
MKRAELEAEIRRLEERLLDPKVRADPEAVGALLDPEFTEIGQYGRVWTRAAILAALAADPSVAGGSIVQDFTVRRVTPDVVLVTYTLPDGGSRRSSLWRKRDAGWQMLFHQGTHFDP